MNIILELFTVDTHGSIETVDPGSCSGRVSVSTTSSYNFIRLGVGQTSELPDEPERSSIYTRDGEGGGLVPTEGRR